jgi:hypothetical protein
MTEKVKSYWSVFGASSLASSVYVAVLNPFDVIKTTEQSLSTTTKSSAVLSNLLRTTGFRSLWRGMRTSLVVTVVNNSVYWGTYETVRPPCTQAFGSLGFVLAGVGSRLISLALVAPIEKYKTRLQANVIGPMSLGLGGYHAFQATLYRDLIFSACYFGLMENIYTAFKTDDSSVGPRIFGSMAGSFVATVFSHPFDLLKTRMQTRYCCYGDWEFKPLQGVLHIKRTEGLASVYAGFTPRVCKLIPGAALYITAYEAIKQVLDS